MNINVDITLRFQVRNVISDEDLDKEYNGNLFRAVEQMLKDEGLFGVVEDNYKLVDVERGDE